MVLLTADSVLLLFITLCVGIFTLAVLEKFFKNGIQANTLGVFLSGLVLCTVYFNIISFWLPVNFYTLVPLFMVSCMVLVIYKRQCRLLFASIKTQAAFFLQPRNLIFTLPVLALLFYYWIIPPINTDSGSYHYLTILWYEKFKVVPGLANLHGRFAFNPVSFIVQAAYSFTAVTGQAIYPLNGVLISMLSLWLLARVIHHVNSFMGLFYCVLLILLLRVLLMDVSSPSSDALFIVCLSYSFIKLFDALVSKTLNLSAALLPVLLLLYSVTAKLASYPALLLIPFVFYLIRKQLKPWPVAFKLAVALLPLYLTWLCRNVILSGYLIYPLPYIDIFTFDWKAPKDVLMLDYLYVRHLSKLFSDDLAYVKTLPFHTWFFKWMATQFSKNFSQDFVVFLIALASPFFWFAVYRKNKSVNWPVFVLWLVLYAAVWFWVNTSPEYRFGMVFMSFAIAIPALAAGAVKKTAMLWLLPCVLLASVSVFFIQNGYYKNTTYPFTLKDYWLYPLKDKRYYHNNNKATFAYTVLNMGIKLYRPDSTHECINTDIPCMPWNYGDIEMRGPNLQDGFINTKNRVPTIYPFVK